MQQSPSWEANGFAASQEIPRIYGTRKFITVLTSARHNIVIKQKQNIMTF
jgi:hypothetical protein